MKIVIVNDYALINGGAAKVALQSAIGLAKRGHPVQVFAGAGPPVPQLANQGIRITCLDQVAYNRDPHVLGAACRGIWNRDAAHRFRALLSACNPEETVVHFHTFREILSASVACTANQMGFVTVYTAHEYTMGCQYGGFFDFRNNRICGLKGLGARCIARQCNTGSYAKKLWNCANQFIYSKIARIPALFSHIIYVSRTSRSVLQAYVPRNQRSSLVSNPIDAMCGEPASIGPSSPFLFIGNFAPHKDPLTAAKAAKKLGARIHFIGTGRLREAIRRINPEAEITDWLDPDAIAERMAAARALVFPSIWYEAQPLAVMEAAASGLSIIAADASAAVEELELLGTGAIFRSGDVDDLAAKMRPFLDDTYAQARGAEAIAAFRRLALSEERYIDRLSEIYEAELALRARQ